MRHFRFKKLRLGAPFAALALAVAACAPAAPTPSHGQATPGSGGILRMGQEASDLGTLDPDFASTTPDRAVVDMVYNALVRYAPGDSRSFEPDLAASLPEPQMVGGKQQWTFDLRHGFMCQSSDGDSAYELTSAEVVYSLQKAADKDRSAFASDYAGFQVEAPDSSTVTIVLDAPESKSLFCPKVATYSGGFILCSQSAEKLGLDGLKTHPAGTGPLQLRAYVSKDRVEFVANDRHFRGRPLLDGVEIRYMPDLSSRQLGLQSGQLDLAYRTADDQWITAQCK
ncbi:MAG: hypothetical protein JOZ81_20145, partial [Chloroflexi bacterium]|nr:hypothetical protein [Chloroflexota bacterium]